MIVIVNASFNTSTHVIEYQCSGIRYIDKNTTTNHVPSMDAGDISIASLPSLTATREWK